MRQPRPMMAMMTAMDTTRTTDNTIIAGIAAGSIITIMAMMIDPVDVIGAELQRPSNLWQHNSPDDDLLTMVVLERRAPLAANVTDPAER